VSSPPGRRLSGAAARSAAATAAKHTTRTKPVSRKKVSRLDGGKAHDPDQAREPKEGQFVDG